MRVFDPKTQKIYIYKDRYSPENTLYVLEKFVDFYSKDFDFFKYQEFRKPILIRFGLHKNTRIIPYSLIT